MLHYSKSDEFIHKLLTPKETKRLQQNYNFFLKGDQRLLLVFNQTEEGTTEILLRENDLYIYSKSKTMADVINEMDDDLSAKEQLLELLLSFAAINLRELNSLEVEISAMEDSLILTPKPEKKGVKEIVKKRSKILSLKRYYTEMEFLTDQMALEDSFFIPADKRFDKLLTYLLHLQEYMEQVREAYQTQIDIEQNNIMKIFTVVTAIFLPLTLITGWYGMNLKMPEFNWEYGYLFVVLICAIVLGGSLCLFKKKKWF